MPENPIIAGKELVITGTFFRTARLRHEWCDFIDPEHLAETIAELSGRADVFTYINELGRPVPANPSWTVIDTAVALLPLSSFEDWWKHLGFKPRNKVRKAGKCGIQFKIVALDSNFAAGVASIYNESPVKQGRRFIHYGKRADAIELELSSFAEKTILVGAYFGNELVGFMKLFDGGSVLRTVHIISSAKHKEKCVMDGLVAKAVEIGCSRGCSCLHYGSWTDGGVGAFREKHGFVKTTTSRAFIPLTWRGRQLLRFNLHRPLRERLPGGLVSALRMLRRKWNEYWAGPRCVQRSV